MTLEKWLKEYEFNQGPFRNEVEWKMEYIKFRIALREFWIKQGITPEWKAAL